MKNKISQVVLVDEKNDGIDDRGRKKVTWQERKIDNLKLAKIYEEINPAKAARIRYCGTELVFTRNEEDKLNLKRANFCRVRLCNMCSWRRALKNYAHLRKVIDAIEDDRNREYSLLTLTIKNCPYEDLEKTINSLNKGINRFNNYKKYKDYVLGTYRTLEITNNRKAEEFHVHYHVLQAHNKTALHKSYVTRQEFAEMWGRAMRLEYEPIVDIRKVKITDRSFILREVTKYICKSDNYITEDDELNLRLVTILETALAYKRFNSWTGIFKYWHKKLDLDKDEEDLVHMEEQVEEDGLTKEEVYVWCDGYQNYFRRE